MAEATARLGSPAVAAWVVDFADQLQRPPNIGWSELVNAVFSNGVNSKPLRIGNKLIPFKFTDETNGKTVGGDMRTIPLIHGTGATLSVRRHPIAFGTRRGLAVRPSTVSPPGSREDKS